MDTKLFEELILRGEKIRETGDPKNALRVFWEAYDLTLEEKKTSQQKAVVFGQMGLCYEHLGILETAQWFYELGIMEVITENPVQRARLLRHLSAIYLKKGDVAEALIKCTEAREIMLQQQDPPTDLVWVTHGIVKIVRTKKLPKETERFWVRTEWQDLKRMWKREKNPIRKNVWLTGFLGDVVYAWYPWALPFAVIAYIISWFSKLNLRKKQILTGKNW